MHYFIFSTDSVSEQRRITPPRRRRRRRRRRTGYSNRNILWPTALPQSFAFHQVVFYAARLDNGPGDSVQSMMTAAVHGPKCFHPPREINITLGLHNEGSDGAGCGEQNAALPRTPRGPCWNTRGAGLAGACRTNRPVYLSRCSRVLLKT
jgi:hypothetical protein